MKRIVRIILGEIEALGVIIGFICALALVVTAAIIAALGYGILFVSAWCFVGVVVIGMYVLAFLLDIQGKWVDAKGKIVQVIRWARV